MTTSEFGLHMSLDGVEWTTVEGLRRSADFVLTDHGFLWLGSDEIRLSTDAMTWQVIPIPEGHFDLARIVGDLIVLGNWETGEVWTATLP
jgi:hypothetical protein